MTSSAMTGASRTEEGNDKQEKLIEKSEDNKSEDNKSSNEMQQKSSNNSGTKKNPKRGGKKRPQTSNKTSGPSFLKVEGNEKGNDNEGDQQTGQKSPNENKPPPRRINKGPQSPHDSLTPGKSAPQSSHTYSPAQEKPKDSEKNEKTLDEDPLTKLKLELENTKKQLAASKKQYSSLHKAQNLKLSLLKKKLEESERKSNARKEALAAVNRARKNQSDTTHPHINYPHKRIDCGVLSSSSSDQEAFCPKCYCALCQIPASQCTKWKLHCRQQPQKQKETTTSSTTSSQSEISLLSQKLEESERALLSQIALLSQKLDGKKNETSSLSEWIFGRVAMKRAWFIGSLSDLSVSSQLGDVPTSMLNCPNDNGELEDIGIMDSDIASHSC